MGFFRWFYQNIFQREYPLICVPRFPNSPVPYSTFCPSKISLVFSKDSKQIWGITDDNISDIIEAVLEHEYLHIIIEQQIGEATDELNNVHRFNLTTNELVWLTRDGKTTFRDICNDGSRFNY